MANVKNFGLIGVGGDVQFAKAGPRIIPNEGTFQLRNATNAGDAALTAAGITSSAGNVTLTTGNVVLSSTAGTLSVGGDTTLSRSIAGVFQFDGTGAVRAPVGSTAQRPSAATGMVRVNNDTPSASLMEYYNGTAWTTLATGGTAVTSVTGTTNRITSTGGTTPVIDIASTYVGQSSITTLGTVTTGTWQGSVIAPAYGGTGVANDPGDTITLGGAVSTGGAFTTTGGAITIASAGPSSVTLPASGTLLSTDTIADNAVTSFSAGTTGFTPSTATDGVVTLAGTLNATHGGTGLATFSVNNVLYASANNVWSAAPAGATSGVQGYDAGLAALAAKTTTGIMVQTGADTYSSVSLVEPTAGITISDENGVAGNPTFALANDLAALEGLASTGFAVRTGTDAWAQRSITGTTDNIVVTNGNGVVSSPTIDLAAVTQGASGSFVKVTLDGYGRVTGNTAVVAADITGLVDATYVNVSGDTMTGSLVMSSGATVTGLPAPVNASDAANKAYVDAVAEGLHVHAPTQYVSVTNLTATYDNGTAGVGATLTNSGGTQAVFALDGGNPTVGQRIMVAGQTLTENNGIYVVTNVGSVSTNWILTRASDFDTPTEMAGGDFVFNQEGTQYANTGWVQTETVVTVGTTPVLFQQFSGAGSYSAGTGLSLAGTVFNVNLGAGIGEFEGDNVGIDLYSTTASALILTTDGSTRAADNASKLALLLPAGSGLTQDATGLYIAADAITNAMLLNDAVSTDADSGTGSLALGGTLNIIGNATQGTQTSVSGGTFTVTALDASDSQKGVATFATTEFVVTSGNVALGLVGATKGGTGFSSYAVGDLLYADTTTSLAKLADVATGNVLLSGGVGVAPSYGKVDLTTTVSGILPAANGGTGVANSNTITLGGNVVTAGSFTTVGANALTLTTTGATNVTLPTSGTLATVAGTVSTFSGGSTGLTPNTATSGAITLGGTLVVANGGTGLSTVTTGQIPYGAGTSPLATSAALSFDGTDTLTVGSATIEGASGGDVTITATATNADINLVPNGTGSVIVGPAGSGVIASGSGETLTVNGVAGLTLTSGTSGNTVVSSAAGTVNLTSFTGDITMTLAAGTTDKVAVAGPTAAQYATGLADTDLVNKYYVDTVAGSATGDVKAVKATFSLAAAGTFNIGAALPAGATILSVKANVTAADTGTGTLSVGKTGSVSAYMTTAEVDSQTAGIYISETMVTEGSSEQVIGTVAGSPAGAGSVTVVVTYQLA